MIKTILITVGALFIALMVFVLYCCLVVASREDERMEILYRETDFVPVCEERADGFTKSSSEREPISQRPKTALREEELYGKQGSPAPAVPSPEVSHEADS